MPTTGGFGVLRLYQSNRAEVLAQALADVLRSPPADAFPADADPLAPEWVVVHSRGMERWLGMQLAQALGICANVQFPFPSGLVRLALEATLGLADKGPDPWSPDRLAWSILKVLPSRLGDPTFAPLRDYLDAGAGAAGGGPVGRRESLMARRLADVFDSYVTYRQDLVLAWDAGARAPGGDEDPDDWQPRHWLALPEGRRHNRAKTRQPLRQGAEIVEQNRLTPSQTSCDRPNVFP